MKRYQVLHLSPHFGGGVGTVLSDYLLRSNKSQNISHSLFLLDSPCSQPSSQVIHSLSLYVANFATLPADQQLSYINPFDVILLHYWNHPLTAELVSRQILRSHKTVLWCHTSGLHIPSINTPYILNAASKVLFTSPVSLMAKDLGEINTSFSVLPSVCDISEYLSLPDLSVRPRDQHSLRFLYVGTVSSAKIHPESLRLFISLALKGHCIDVVGGPDHKSFAQQVPQSLRNKIIFHGLVADVKPYLSRSHVFIYPLSRSHFGTGEQALVEAMASALPVLVLDNPCEMSILGPLAKKFACSSVDHLLERARRLELNHDVLIKESQLVREYAASTFSHESMAKRLDEELVNQCRYAQHLPTLSPAYSVLTRFDQPFRIFMLSVMPSLFLDSLSGHKSDSTSALISRIADYLLVNASSPAALLGPAKGSPAHYLLYFPDSTGLRLLCDQINAKCGIT